MKGKKKSAPRSHSTRLDFSSNESHEERDSQSLSVNLNKQDPLDGGSSIRVDDVVGGRKVLNEERKNGDKLLFGEL